MPRKGHSEQWLCTVSQKLFLTKTVFFFALGVYCVSHILVYGHEKKVNRFMGYLRWLEKRNMKKGWTIFFCSHFYSTHRLCLTMGCLNPLFTFSLPNHYSIMAIALQFFFCSTFLERFFVEANGFLESDMRRSGNLNEKLIFKRKSKIYK